MASINDLVTEARKTTNPTLTTVFTARSIGGSSLVCTDLTGWPTNTAVHFITYKKTAAGLIDKSTQCDWKGLVSSNTISSLTLKSGTDAGNSVGDFVEMGPTAAYAQDMASAIEAEHSTLGVHDATKVAMLAGAQTFTGQKTFTSPKVVTDISDTNGNEIFKITATGSAVNELTVANGATGTGPTITASGGDSNVDINFATKGTGKLKGVVNNLNNPYKFSVYRSAAQSIAGSSTVKVQFDSKNFDTGSNFDSTTNYRFTAPIAGFYLFTYTVGILSTVSGASVTAYIYKNGSSSYNGSAVVSGGVSNTYSSGSILLQLAANDYTEVFINSGEAGSKNLANGQQACTFSGFLVSAT